MALPGSGALSLNDINVELGNSSSSVASMDTMTAAAIGDSNITNQPDAVSDWYNYSHCIESVPSTPGSRTAADIGSAIIQVTWASVANADSYTHRRSTNGSTWTNETTTTSLSYSTSISPGNWYWQVRANNCAGSSSYGNMSPYPVNIT